MLSLGRYLEVKLSSHQQLSACHTYRHGPVDLFIDDLLLLAHPFSSSSNPWAPSPRKTYSATRWPWLLSPSVAELAANFVCNLVYRSNQTPYEVLLLVLDDTDHAHVLAPARMTAQKAQKALTRRNCEGGPPSSPYKAASFSALLSLHVRQESGICALIPRRLFSRPVSVCTYVRTYTPRLPWSGPSDLSGASHVIMVLEPPLTNTMALVFSLRDNAGCQDIGACGRDV